MPRLKPLARDDVLSYGRTLRAAPLAAFRRDKWGDYKPRAAMWRLLREPNDGGPALDPERPNADGERTGWLNTRGRCRYCGESLLRWHHVPAHLCSTRCARERKRATSRAWAKASYQPHERTAHGATCGHCGERFDATRSDARFCSPRCRVAAHRAA